MLHKNFNFYEAIYDNKVRCWHCTEILIPISQKKNAVSQACLNDQEILKFTHFT